MLTGSSRYLLSSVVSLIIIVYIAIVKSHRHYSLLYQYHTVSVSICENVDQCMIG